MRKEKGMMEREEKNSEGNRGKETGRRREDRMEEKRGGRKGISIKNRYIIYFSLREVTFTGNPVP